MPALSMKGDSTRSCVIDGCPHSPCKDWKSYENSEPDWISSYQNGSGIMDMLNEKFDYNGVTSSVMRYCGDDRVVQGGLFPAQLASLVMPDNFKVEDIGPVTVDAEEFGAVHRDEIVREDAPGNAKINEQSTAGSHWFLNDSSCFDQFALGAEDIGPINLQVAELDYLLKNNIQGFSAELIFPSAMTEDCFVIPSLEETVSAPFDQFKGFYGDFWTSLDNDLQLHVTSNHRSDAYNPAAVVDFGFMDSEDAESADPMSFIRSFLNLSGFEANSLPALLPQETSRKWVTLVLDLDETLVHSTTKPCADADFSFQIPINMEEKTVYVRRRPFLKVFLERVSEMFEIILFTASQKMYAELLLDNLDPERKFFSRSAFRDSCVLADGIFTKDLTVLGVDLAKVAIVDNTPQVYRWQVNNGIPIKSWYDDPLDSELMNLLPFLETLVDVDDVRPIIAQKFAETRQQ
ncbi:hypothetical protein MLD38_011279 [Melastoma candidum]|uniref:Uncharacterized protein n=1 Tax=Melastoma candidum TaxID=119954 RepID=A0ACB9R2L5_9MYRT|nr:hypothetical protein MLD38_011279 [Melastoma candidum]